MSWNTTKITADAAEKMRINSGLLVNSFDIDTPAEPEDADILCETTGDISIKCAPVLEDLFADVNNAPKDTKEGLHVTGWDCGLSFTSISVTAEMLALSIGAAAKATQGTTKTMIYTETTLSDLHFKTLYWIGDMLDSDKLLVVKLANAFSNGGLSLTTTDKGKGKLAVSLKPYSTITDPDTCPMEFYILTKSASATTASEEV